MPRDPLHAPRELDVFRTVRRVADEDVRAVTLVAPDRPSVAAARAALQAATTAEDIVALEPLVVTAWSELRLAMASDRTVRSGARDVPWDEVGCYRGVVEAARAEARPAGP
jgi:hypothetical protein